MPLYDYVQTAGHCAKCKGRFEVFQRIADEKLTHCPACHKPCERIISAVSLGGKYSTSDAKVKSLGMTKYKKAGKGVYERTAGTGGPKIIHRKTDA